MKKKTNPLRGLLDCSSALNFILSINFICYAFFQNVFSLASLFIGIIGILGLTFCILLWAKLKNIK